VPWTAKDASGKTKKASTPKRKRQWKDIANNLLAHGKSEKQAIVEANGVLKRVG
jgi:uncharacterized protein YdaT